MIGDNDQRELLLLVTKLAGKVSGKTKLQKLVYLVQTESGIPRWGKVFAFEPYLYGPFSDEVSSVVDQLVGEELVNPDHYLYVAQGKTGVTSSFELSEKGQQAAERVAKSTPPDQLAALRGVVEKYRYEPLPRILDYVYSKYPEFAQHSRGTDQP